MDKKYFDGGAFQVLPMALAVMLANPFGNLLLDTLGIESSVTAQIIAGSVCGASVAIVAWLIMVLIDQAKQPKK